MRLTTVLLTICTAALALVPLRAPAGPIVESGNLLVNPGAETGSLGPWESIGFSVSDQPASLPAGTIDATDGDWWFRADSDIEIDDESSSTLVKIGIVPMLQKRIDVRGFGHIESITFGGDAFGVFEVLAGSPQLVRMDGVLQIQLFDEDLQAIPGGQFGGGEFARFFSMEANPGETLDLHDTIVPLEGLAFISFLAQMNPRVVGSAGDSALFHLAFDDLHLSVAYQVPELAGLTLAALGAFLVTFLRIVSRPRRAACSGAPRSAQRFAAIIPVSLCE